MYLLIFNRPTLSFEKPKNTFTDEEVLNEEELDKELLWNLQLLSEVRCLLSPAS